VDTGAIINYALPLPTEVAGILPLKVHGYRVPSMIKNGDTFVNVKEVREFINENKNFVNIKRGTSTKIDSSELMIGWHDADKKLYMCALSYAV